MGLTNVIMETRVVFPGSLSLCVNTLSNIKYINNPCYKYARLLKDKNAAVPPSRRMVLCKARECGRATKS